jgi:ubiquinone/menaquinone biosynthesis C-methylase UbiE
MNKNFLYGGITKKFLKQITFEPGIRQVLDIGCGTGFVFDVLYNTFKVNGMKGLGIEPADGMLKIAIERFGNDSMFSFAEGSFESIPLDDCSVDHIVSTLALHWVKSLEVATAEMHRVLKDDGKVSILMIAKDDGAIFKKAIVEALKKHLSFEQIMKTAGLVQRAKVSDVEKAFSIFANDFNLRVIKHNELAYGTFDDHMKWWTARSTPVIAEVKDKNRFMEDLREELEKTNTKKGIPFDLAYYWILLD